MVESGPAIRQTDELPRVIPIFPLPGVLLLPRGRLPLNIFEPRYLQMTEDAMSAHRMIGMVQPADPRARLDHPAVYPTGCIGRIISYAETPDDRYLITLSGICRFTILREIEGRGVLYREVCASYDAFAADLREPPGISLEREPFVTALRCYFAAHDLTADWDVIARLDDLTLVTRLAMACPFKPNEKQALLECATDAERAGMMRALFEIAVHERDGGAAIRQ